MNPTAPIHATREQDNFAEQLAETFASVEVRMAMDGVAIVTGIVEVGQQHEGQRVWLIDQDGEPLSMDASIARRAIIGEWLAQQIRAIDVRDDDYAEQVRHAYHEAGYSLMGREYEDFENPDVWEVAVARRSFATKGGPTTEPGDVVLVALSGVHTSPGYHCIYGWRRMCLVSAPFGVVNTL